MTQVKLVRDMGDYKEGDSMNVSNTQREWLISRGYAEGDKSVSASDNVKDKRTQQSSQLGNDANQNEGKRTRKL
jgi:hypothetical protein